MVYLAIKNGQVACRTNADTMRRLDGVEPELINHGRGVSGAL